MISKADYKENKEETFKALEEYTKSKVPALRENYEEVSFIYEENNKVLGRIVGHIHWDHLQIELFSVSSEARGKGVGSKILKYVEKLAEEKNLAYILLETMSFNAPGFYEKNGYNVCMKIENSPFEGAVRYFYKKDIK